MTIDEAISIMNVIVHMLEPQYDTDRIEEAVEMAIKALKQQVTDAVDRVTIKEYLESFGNIKTEQEPCEDCISRQQAIDKMQELEEEDIEAYGCSIPEGFDGKRAIEALKDLSSAHPKPKMGHWISLDTGKPSHLKDGMTTEGVKCSECGEWLIASDEYACYGRYCANCGCAMREVNG